VTQQYCCVTERNPYHRESTPINSRRVCLLAHANRRTNGSLQFKSTPMCIQTLHCEGPYIGRSTQLVATQSWLQQYARYNGRLESVLKQVARIAIFIRHKEIQSSDLGAGRATRQLNRYADLVTLRLPETNRDRHESKPFEHIYLMGPSGCLEGMQKGEYGLLDVTPLDRFPPLDYFAGRPGRSALIIDDKMQKY
jgi:hypothetical protein